MKHINFIYIAIAITFLRNSSINLMAKEATDEIKIIYQSVTRKDNVHRYPEFLLLFFHVAKILTGTTITYRHFGRDSQKLKADALNVLALGSSSFIFRINEGTWRNVNRRIMRGSSFARHIGTLIMAAGRSATKR